ncbi:MAG: hypothetical protein JW787_07450 [Sedimentisphaerales bacterium]|nr:hypothetical protein [Sedimentisphaerales bacterium]
MKRLFSIILVMLIAIMFSGCVIVDAHYHRGHGYRSGVVVTNYPPPPPVYPVYVVRPPISVPPPYIIYDVRRPLPPRDHRPPAPPSSQRSSPPRPEARRDLRR